MSKVKTKVCTQCGVEKPATPEYYHRRSKVKDGLHGECKTCRLTRQVEYNKRKEAEAKAKIEAMQKAGAFSTQGGVK